MALSEKSALSFIQTRFLTVFPKVPAQVLLTQVQSLPSPIPVLLIHILGHGQQILMPQCRIFPNINEKLHF